MVYCSNTLLAQRYHLSYIILTPSNIPKISMYKWSNFLQDYSEQVFLYIVIHAGGAIMTVATDRMQQWARIDASLGLPCLRNPNKFILPILINGGIPNIGEEDESGKTADKEAQIVWQEPVAQEKAKAKTETADALVTRKN